MIKMTKTQYRGIIGVVGVVGLFAVNGTLGRVTQHTNGGVSSWSASDVARARACFPKEDEDYDDLFVAAHMVDLAEHVPMFFLSNPKVEDSTAEFTGPCEITFAYRLSHVILGKEVESTLITKVVARNGRVAIAGGKWGKTEWKELPL